MADNGGNGFHWRFEQLQSGGKKGPAKILELEGYAAPFGRPRKNPVAKELIKSRIQTKHYPGTHGPPTRHTFGTNWEPMELTGRWMTKHLIGSADVSVRGRDANQIANRWIEFLRDERTVRISWGPVVSYVGYLEELELSRESPHEIAWRMKWQVDRRDDTPSRKTVTPPRPVRDDLSELQEGLLTFPQVPTDIEVKPDLFASLNALAGQVNKYSAELNKLAGQLDDFEKATFGTIAAFHNTIVGMREAILTMRDAVLNVGIDAAILARTAEADVTWFEFQLDYDSETMTILRLLADMDRKAELQGKTEVSRIIEAKEGDTWESLAVRAYGTADKSGTLRGANGATYGEEPVAGQSYMVP